MMMTTVDTEGKAVATTIGVMYKGQVENIFITSEIRIW